MTGALSPAGIAVKFSGQLHSFLGAQGDAATAGELLQAVVSELGLAPESVRLLVPGKAPLMLRTLSPDSLLVQHGEQDLRLGC